MERGRQDERVRESRRQADRVIRGPVPCSMLGVEGVSLSLSPSLPPSPPPPSLSGTRLHHLGPAAARRVRRPVAPDARPRPAARPARRVRVCARACVRARACACVRHTCARAAVCARAGLRLFCVCVQAQTALTQPDTGAHSRTLHVPVCRH